MKDFRADGTEGTDFYMRATPAHANCVENLPVYAAILFASHASPTVAAPMTTVAIDFRPLSTEEGETP